MTLPMARDLARFKIRVNTLAPGYIFIFFKFFSPIATSMGKAIPEKARIDLEKNIPLGRMGKPEEFA